MSVDRAEQSSAWLDAEWNSPLTRWPQNLSTNKHLGGSVEGAALLHAENGLPGRHASNSETEWLFHLPATRRNEWA
jgi:hypothetical protein